MRRLKLLGYAMLALQCCIALFIFTVFRTQLLAALAFYHSVVGPVFLLMLYHICLSLAYLVLNTVDVGLAKDKDTKEELLAVSKNYQEVVLTLGTLGTFIAMAIAHQAGGVTLDIIPVALYSTIMALVFRSLHTNLTATTDT